MVKASTSACKASKAACRFPGCAASRAVAQDARFLGRTLGWSTRSLGNEGNTSMHPRITASSCHACRPASNRGAVLGKMSVTLRTPFSNKTGTMGCRPVARSRSHKSRAGRTSQEQQIRKGSHEGNALLIIVVQPILVAVYTPHPCPKRARADRLGTADMKGRQPVNQGSKMQAPLVGKCRVEVHQSVPALLKHIVVRCRTSAPSRGCRISLRIEERPEHKQCRANQRTTLSWHEPNRNSSLDSDHLCCGTESTLSMTCPFVATLLHDNQFACTEGT